ncbi:MAG: four helix bundle protein [Bacteroidota bacterium]|jgi:four helix bundle protein
MAQAHTPPKYDLEERTLRFAKETIKFVGLLPKTLPNIEIARQLVRSAGSVGANYIEANESLGKKDFLMRIKISRKESKESRYWLELVTCDNTSKPAQERLIRESMELMKIFGAILRNSMS